MRLFKPPSSAFSAEPVSPSRRNFLATACACCAVWALDPAPALAQSPEVQRHLALAREAAGTDLLSYFGLSQIAAPTPGLRRVSPDELMRMPTPPPGQAFDNLFFVGNRWVSAWAVVTSDGIILIDAMDNDDEAEHIIDAGMRKLGLDPKSIKMVVVTHGHGDHYGGVGYLKRKYNPQIIASTLDWTMMETALEFDRPDWGRPPQRDVAVDDGSVLRLGDTSIDVLLTPGHTMGTISLLFNARSGGATHRVMLWGGTAFNFGRRADRLTRIDAYIAATDRAREIAVRQNVDVFISNHNIYDQAVEKLETMARGGPNPFVLGSATTARALTVMNECAKATRVVWSS